MTFTDRVNTITQEKIIPLVVDQVMDGNVLAARALDAVVRPWTGGEFIAQPIRTAANANVGSFEGTDTLTTGLENTRRKMLFYPKAYYASVTISGMEKAVNKGMERVLSLVATEVETAKESMIDSLGAIFYADGSGNSGKDFDGLASVVADSGSYGSLARATYTVLEGYTNAATGAMSLAKMNTLLRNTSASSSRRERPTLGLGDQENWDIIEALFTTPEAKYDAANLPVVGANTAIGRASRDEASLKGRAGYVALFFRGIPIVADDASPAAQTIFMNEHYQRFSCLKSDDLAEVPSLENTIESTADDADATPQSAPIQWKQFDSPTNQFTMIGWMSLMGEYWSARPNRNGILDGVTG